MQYCKRITGTCMMLFIAFYIHAQVIQPASAKPGQKNLPGNLKPVTKANLTITAISLSSATGGNDRWDITLAVTIKNTGGIQAPPSRMKVWAQDAAAAANPWKELASFDLAAVSPATYITKEFRIIDKNWVMHKIPQFYLKCQADCSNQVTESSEADNESPVIRISNTR